MADEFVLTKQEAEEAMSKGKKVQHRNFSPDEWMELTLDGKYRLEDGVICSKPEFWRWRTGDSWLTGWAIYKGNKELTDRLFELMRKQIYGEDGK